MRDLAILIGGEVLPVRILFARSYITLIPQLRSEFSPTFFEDSNER